MLVLLLARNEAPRPPLEVELGPLQWTWSAPHLTREGDTWRSGAARLEVLRRPQGLHWELRAPAGVVPPLRFHVSGATSGRVMADGSLALSAGTSLVTEKNLLAWQDLPDGGRRPLRARYEGLRQHRGGVEYAIALEDVDPALPLVVDPDVDFFALTVPGTGEFPVALASQGGVDYLLFSSSTGGARVLALSGSTIVASRTLPNGVTPRDLKATPTAVYVLGETPAPLPGELVIGGGGNDLVLLQLNPTTLAVITTLRLGTTGSDSAVRLALRTLDSGGAPIAADLVAIVGTTLGQDTFPGVGAAGGSSVLVLIGPTTLSDWPTQLRASRFGGSGDENVFAATWSPTGLWVVGSTSSNDLNVSTNALQAAPDGTTDGMLLRFDDNATPTLVSYFGTPRLFSISFAGRDGITVTGVAGAGLPLHRAFLPEGAGRSAFVAVLSSSGDALLSASRFPTGSSNIVALTDQVTAIGSVSADDTLPLLAPTQSKRNGESDVTLTLWDAPSGLPVWSSYLGGAQSEDFPFLSNVETLPRPRLAFGVATRSSDFSNNSTPRADWDVAVVSLSDPWQPGDVVGVVDPPTTADACSPPFVLRNPSAWARTTGRAVVVRAADSSLFADPECRTPLAAVEVAAGAQEGLFFVKAPRSAQGTLDLSTPMGITIGGLSAMQVQSQSRAAVPLPMGLTLKAQQCHPLGTFSAGATLSALSGGERAAVLFGDALCTVPRSNQPQVSFQSSTPGVFWLQSAGGGTSTSTGMVAVEGTGSPDGYALAPGSRRLVAGECSGAQFVVRSTARGDPATGADDSAVLESDQLRFFSDFDCRTSMANVDLGANDAISRPFYVMGPLTGLNTLTVRGTLGEASFPFEVLPNRVAKVRVRGPSTLPLSTGCDLLWLESADARDNLSAEQRAAGAVSLSMSGTGQVAFFSDRECRFPMTSRTWPSGMWKVPVWVKGTHPGTVNVTALHPDISGSFSLLVLGGSALASLQLNSPPALQVGLCSGAFVVRGLDGSSQPTPVLTNLTLQSDSTLSFFSNASCTTALTQLAAPISTSGATFYVRTATAGTQQIKVGTGDSATTVTVTLNASGLVIRTTPSSVSVPRDGCASVSVELLDAALAPATATVNVSSTGAVPLTFGTTGCTSSPTASLAFTASGPRTLFIRGGSIGAGQAFFSASGSSLTLPVQLTSPAVSTWHFKSQPDGGAAAFTALAGACTPLGIEALDAVGRTTTGSAPPLAGGPTFTFHSLADCDGGLITRGPASIPESGATVFARATQAQVTQVFVGDAGQLDSAPFTVLAGAPASLSVPPSLAFDARTCASLGPIGVLDAWANPIASWPSGVTVNATTGVTTSLAADCTGAATSTTLSSFPATLAVTATAQGSATLTFSGAGVPNATTALTLGWPAAVGLRFEPAPPQPVELQAGACGATRLVAFDDAGVPTRSPMPVALSASTTSARLFSNATCAAPAATSLPSLNELGAPLSFSETRAGATTLQVGGLQLALQIDAGPPQALQMDPVSLVSKDCPAPFAVRVVDAFGNPSATSDAVTVTARGALGLTVAQGASCGTQTSALLLFNAEQARSVSLTARRAGVASLQLTSMTGLPPLTVPVTVTAGLNEAPTVSVLPAVIELDESDAGRADLLAFDPDWDPLSWAWQQTAGPSRALTLFGPTQSGGDFQGSVVFVAPRVTQDTEFDYVVLLNDDAGHVVDSGVRFRVRDSINEPPTAIAEVLDAGVFSSGAEVRLSGARSFDPNPLDQLTLAWVADAGLVTFADPTRPDQSFVAPPVGPQGATLHFELTAFDQRGGVSAPSSVEVAVVARDTPVITSRPRILAQLGQAWAYDEDGRASATTTMSPVTYPVRWSLVGPAEASVDATTGQLSWTPVRAETASFVLRATTAFGWAEQAFTVQVLAAPVITSTPRTTAALFVSWLYDADGRAEATGATWWQLGTHPTGMVIEGSTGLITWTPLVQGLVRVEVIALNSVGEARQTFDVLVGDGTTVTIADTANRQAQRGVGYVFDADRTIDVSPPGTAVRLVAGPDRFFVSPRGEVSWIPTAVGTFDVEVAAGAPVSAVYRFSVTVSEPSSEAPVARGTASPDSAPEAPLSTTLDGTASSAASGRTLVLWSWEAGDGTPPRYAPQTSVTYPRPGGFTPRLEVADDLGNRASTTVNVGVGIDGVLPPIGDIVVTATQSLGGDRTSVSFRCECRDPAGLPLALLWRFGDGTTSDQAAPEHVYASASVFRVRLDVSNGRLVTQVVKELEVKSGERRPPTVRAWGEPVFGRAPLTVKFTSAASDFDGVITARRWDFGNGVTAVADDTTFRFDEPGMYTVRFRGTDDEGLSSEDSVDIIVTTEDDLAPPQFTSRPTSRTAKLGVAWKYDEDGRLAARGATRYGVGRQRGAQVVGVPDGLTVDATTGLVSWTPSAAGAWPVVFWAENAAGRVWQDDLVLDVPPAAGGCGCSSAEPFGLLAIALALLGARRRVRHRAAVTVRSTVCR
jgi:PKD repeat protein